LFTIQEEGDGGIDLLTGHVLESGELATIQVKLNHIEDMMFLKGDMLVKEHTVKADFFTYAIILDSYPRRVFFMGWAKNKEVLKYKPEMTRTMSHVVPQDDLHPMADLAKFLLSRPTDEERLRYIDSQRRTEGIVGAVPKGGLIWDTGFASPMPRPDILSIWRSNVRGLLGVPLLWPNNEHRYVFIASPRC
jgi:hypothetical protein